MTIRLLSFVTRMRTRSETASVYRVPPVILSYTRRAMRLEERSFNADMVNQT